MTDTRQVGIGLIGCGSRLTGVIQSTLHNDNRIKVVALCDVSDTAIKQAKERLRCPDARVYPNHHELSADPKVEWVCVGSWNAFHKEHILGALQANKHVFTEKPLTTNIDDCAVLKKAIDSHTGMFSIGFVLRYAEFYRRIKALIDGGVIGKLVSFEFNETLSPDHGGYIMMDWRRKREWAGTHLLEKCCHDIDLVNWLTGSVPVRAASFGGLNFFLPQNKHRMDELGPHANGLPAYCGWRNSGIYTRENPLDPFTTDKDIIDNQVAILEYASGVRATFHTNLNTSIAERRMYFCGTHGTIRGDVRTGLIEYKRIDHEKAVLTEKTTAGGHGGADGTMANALRNSMLDGTPPLVGLDDGIRSAVACFGIDAALDTGSVYDMRPMWQRVGIRP
ncbi:MAG: gfo/Idh/MocA family oxidoreductase [Phycisphaera sp.]|nr:gfo/Idh/MocA family oxidoreductase [Phycisphaera sp.]